MSFWSILAFLIVLGLLVYNVYKLVISIKKRKKAKLEDKQVDVSPDDSQKN